ncbi:Flowering time control protein FCA [Quillaja saponaria]|uniref:Flowering time control protein FCA n=1 Tax=Quillaja saponaria TaxID=32244 RepID=A0AAD7QAC6_QUISA|nr:Flowering time control protein FCA [Quillaja saponaria]
MNGATNDSLIREGFRSNNGVSGHDPNHSVHHPGRKRGWDHGRGASSDRKEGCHVKLYVAPVPRTATEASIRPVFEGYGPIVEVVLVKDKNTGQQQGYCFVKYATLDGAERAIRSLNNLYTFPGELSPLLVKFSDGERKRLEVLDRVFVGGLNKFATKKDIEEVFSPFGHVEDVFIVCDDQKRSRGYGFVKFSNRDMALAAIKGLNGIFTMKGCHQPLIVRFADPKKPRTGEPRPPPNVGDSAGGRILPMAPNHSTVPLPQAASHVNNWGPATGIVQQPFPPQQPLSQLPPMPFQPDTNSTDVYSNSNQWGAETVKSCPIINSKY